MRRERKAVVGGEKEEKDKWLLASFNRSCSLRSGIRASADIAAQTHKIQSGRKREQGMGGRSRRNQRLQQNHQRTAHQSRPFAQP